MPTDFKLEPPQHGSAREAFGPTGTKEVSRRFSKFGRLGGGCGDCQSAMLRRDRRYSSSMARASVAITRTGVSDGPLLW
jgi:hypothetical protein